MDERANMSANNSQNDTLSLSSYSESTRRTSLCRRLTNCWRREWTWFLPAFLVFYSFIKEVKVGEPFLFKYQTEFLNLTRDQLKGKNLKLSLNCNLYNDKDILFTKNFSIGFY
jgi:hypothetical protein